MIWPLATDWNCEKFCFCFCCLLVELIRIINSSEWFCLICCCFWFHIQHFLFVSSVYAFSFVIFIFNARILKYFLFWMKMQLPLMPLWIYALCEFDTCVCVYVKFERSFSDSVVKVCGLFVNVRKYVWVCAIFCQLDKTQIEKCKTIYTTTNTHTHTKQCERENASKLSWTRKWTNQRTAKTTTTNEKQILKPRYKYHNTHTSPTATHSKCEQLT